MEKKFLSMLAIFLLIILFTDEAKAQEKQPAPPTQEQHVKPPQRGIFPSRRMPPRIMRPQSFFVKKIQYTIEDMTLTLDIHFNGPVDPVTLENTIEGKLKRENIESFTYTYNRSADKVRVVAELKEAPMQENFSFSLQGTLSFDKGPLMRPDFENIEPSTVYEFEEDGTWKKY